MIKRRFLNLVIGILALAIPVFFILTALFFAGNDYNAFIIAFAKLLHKPGWTEFFKSSFPESSFENARVLLFFLSGISLLISFFLFRNLNCISSGLSRFFSSLSGHTAYAIQTIRHHSLAEKIFIGLLLPVIFLVSLYHILVQPMQYDEMWTYNYFIGGGFWRTFLIPGNNHIGYTVIAWLFKWLPVNQDIAIRLPALLAGILLILCFWLMCRRLFGSSIAMVSATFFSSMALVTTYLVLARSYSMLLLCSLFLLWVSIKLIRDRQNTFYKQFYLLILIAGYLVNPLFGFGHLVQLISFFMIGGFRRDYKTFIQLIYASVIAGLILTIFYMPDLVTSHLGLIAASFAAPPSAGNAVFIKESFAAVSQHITGIYSAWFLLPAISILLLFLKQDDEPRRFLIYCSVVSFLLMFVILLIQQRFLPERFFIFLSIPVALCLGILLEKFKVLSNLSFRSAVILSLIIFLISSFRTYNYSHFYLSEKNDFDCKEISQVLITANADSCYIQHPDFKPGLEYYARKENRLMVIRMADEKSLDYMPA